MSAPERTQVDDLRARVCALLRSLDLDASDDQLLEQTAQVEAIGRAVDAARTMLAGEVADRSRRDLGADALARQRGCRNAEELLERVTGIAGATARARTRAAGPLRAGVALTGEPMPARFPLVAHELASGRLGADAAATIVNALAAVGDHGATADAVSAAERELLEAAATASADEVAIMARAWALFLDPDGALPVDARALRRRGLTIGRENGGTVSIRGDLLPEVAAQLQRLFDAFLNPKVADAPGPRFEPEPVDGSPVDSRTTPQRRHDAFAGILSVAAGVDGMPLLGGAPPTLVVSIEHEHLGRSNGVAFLPSRGGDDTGAVRAAVAHHTGCAGQIQRIVFLGGRVVDLGSPQRIFTAHQRRAIATRDGECIIPGCHVPAAWCEVHHVEEHTRGGATHTDNGVLLCWFHHRSLDSSGWEIRMIRGVPWTRPPAWLDPARRWRAAGRRRTARATGPPFGI